MPKQDKFLDHRDFPEAFFTVEISNSILLDMLAIDTIE